MLIGASLLPMHIIDDSNSAELKQHLIRPIIKLYGVSYQVNGSSCFTDVDSSTLTWNLINCTQFLCCSNV